VSIDSRQFIVEEGARVDLKDWPTRVTALYKSKDEYERLLAGHVKQMSKLQEVLYAHNRYALLLIFQAMDAAGKDGAIQHVMSGINPVGCQVFSFKQPSAEELDHDFLWRTTVRLPERGRIGIFNRSYYEEVLVVRVHPAFLDGQDLPESARRHLWRKRFRSIVDFERHLQENGTRIVKFFLHVSKEEQRKRFVARIDEPDKNWKFGQHDVEERRYWNDYMRAYEKCLTETSSKESPWYIVPADDKLNTRLIVSQTIIDTLSSLRLGYPKVTDARKRELAAVRRQLTRQSPRRRKPA
jgi:PPK2 family polyphosphate:nucleotide phosphotransferase